MKKLIATGTLLLAVPMLASAQNSDHPYRGQGYVFFGLGTSNIPSYDCYHCLVIKHVGGGGEGFLYKGFGVGMEVGYANWGSYDDQAWIGSGDASYHFRRNTPRGVDPFVLIGVTGYFPATEGRGTPAGNFGGGVNLWFREHAAVRLEVRDHFSNGAFGLGSHYISFRFGVTFR